ncbi:MAG TPA: hypothetical protein VGO67_15475 [Verrucomicrobiae bacterium]|jgi:hypothetical protein
MTNLLSETVWIENEHGNQLKVELTNEGGELLGKIVIDSIPYHVFFAKRGEIRQGKDCFIVDRDRDYEPKSSASGRYLLIAPYAK